MTTKVPVARPVLQWALRRANRQPEEATRKFPKLDGWFDGSVQPTVKQLEDFARYTYTSLGELVMSEPPVEELPVADMRTPGSVPLGEPSGDLLDTMSRYQHFQGWYRDYALDQGAQPLEFVGSVAATSDARRVAARVRDMLGLDSVRAKDPASWRRALVSALEDLGVLVMMSGIVGTNSHRRLSIKEFRGFALTDAIAPLIFVNLAGEAVVAQNFTLLHEFAHILAGHSALSGGEQTEWRGGEEAWCNAVAAYALLPDRVLEEFRSADSAVDYRRIAKQYGTSAEVALHRLHAVGRLPDAYYRKMLESLYGGMPQQNLDLAAATSTTRSLLGWDVL